MIKYCVRGTKRWWPVFLLVLAGLGSQPGCGLFSIRAPVEPPPGEKIPRKAFIDPDSVLYNIEVAVRYKSLGVPLYDEALEERFSLVLDPLDVLELGTGVDSLDKTDDIGAQRLIASDTALPDSFYFAFGNVQAERKDTTAFYLDMPYHLYLIDTQGDTTDVICGKADLSMVESQKGAWSLRRWLDKRQDECDVSFGRFHAERAIQTAPRRRW